MGGGRLQQRTYNSTQGLRDESDMATMGVWTLQSGAPELRLNELNRLIHSLLLSLSVGPNCWNSSFLTMAKCTKTSLFLLLMQITSALTGSVIMWSGKHTCTHSHLVKDPQRCYYDTWFFFLLVFKSDNFPTFLGLFLISLKKTLNYMEGKGNQTQHPPPPHPVLCRPKQLTKK